MKEKTSRSVPCVPHGASLRGAERGSTGPLCWDLDRGKGAAGGDAGEGAAPRAGSSGMGSRDPAVGLLHSTVPASTSGPALSLHPSGCGGNQGRGGATSVGLGGWQSSEASYSLWSSLVQGRILSQKTVK